MTKSRHLTAPRHRWTAEEEALVRQYWPRTTAAALADMLGLTLGQVYKKARQMGCPKLGSFWASPASGRLDGVRGQATRFKPGQVPWSYGTRGLPLGGATRFKPGSVPANVQEVGALRINTLGDIDIKLAPGKGQWLSLRRYVWENAVGPIAPGMCVMVLDHDPHNTQRENLALGTRADNVRHNLLARYPKELRSAMQLGGRLRNMVAKRTEELQEMCDG